MTVVVASQVFSRYVLNHSLFWSEELARLERINAQRFRRNLLDALGKLLPRAQAERIVQELVAMVDGLWLRKAQNDQAVTPEAACALVFSYLDRRLGSAAGRGG